MALQSFHMCKIIFIKEPKTNGRVDRPRGKDLVKARFAVHNYTCDPGSMVVGLVAAAQRCAVRVWPTHVQRDSAETVLCALRAVGFCPLPRIIFCKVVVVSCGWIHFTILLVDECSGLELDIGALPGQKVLVDWLILVDVIAFYFYV